MKTLPWTTLLVAVALGCGRPEERPATLATLLENGTWLRINPPSTATHLPDGGMDPGPWQLYLATDGSPGCYTFSGDATLDGEPLEQSSNGGWELGGFPPSYSCHGAYWRFPEPIPDVPLSTVRISDGTAEATMEVVRLGAHRFVYLAGPDGGVLSWGGELTVGWSVPGEHVQLDVRFESDAGYEFSTTLGSLPRGTEDGGLETFVLPDGGSAIEGTLTLIGLPIPDERCEPATLGCFVDLGIASSQQTVTIR